MAEKRGAHTKGGVLTLFAGIMGGLVVHQGPQTPFNSPSVLMR